MPPPQRGLQLVRLPENPAPRRRRLAWRRSRCGSAQQKESGKWWCFRRYAGRASLLRWHPNTDMRRRLALLHLPKRYISRMPPAIRSCALKSRSQPFLCARARFAARPTQRIDQPVGATAGLCPPHPAAGWSTLRQGVMSCVSCARSNSSAARRHPQHPLRVSRKQARPRTQARTHVQGSDAAD
jgi:hypothetical protein